MTCRWPDHRPSTGYQYGCRCERCAGWHRDYFRAYMRAHGWRYRQPPKPRRQPVPALERILARIVVDVATGCWLWPGYRSSNGYGRIDRGQLTHRIMAEHYHGAIPDGYEVDHLCHVRACCNPDHLDVVHRLENASRAWTWSRAVNSGLVVLDAATVRRCRIDYHQRHISIRELAQRHDVNVWTMKDAVTGRTWGAMENSEERRAG